METRSKRKRIGPLPGGDRRGALGADAECYSMRTVSGRGLNRRTPTESLGRDITAEDNDRLSDSRNNSPIEPYSPSTVSYTPSVPSSPTISTDQLTPNLDVAREENSFLPASTKAGKPRMRMKWTNDVNLFIMRTYYYITKLETDLTIYRKRLHELFSQKYPDVKVSEQRISDQRRTIIRNKLLSQTVLNQLIEEARLKLQEEEERHTDSQTQSTHISQQQSHTQSQLTQPETLTQFVPLNTQTTNTTSTQTELVTLLIENEIEVLPNADTPSLDRTSELRDKFRTTLTLYSGMDPAARPKLPKLRYSPKTTELIRIFNETILVDYVTENSELTDVHTLIYCTAAVISEDLGYKIQHKNTQTHKNRDKPPWQIRLEKDIEKLRADIGRLTQYINNNRSRKLVKKVETIIKNNTLHTRHENKNKKPEEFLDTLKQKLALKVHRLKRYNKRNSRKTDNVLFETNEKSFYKQLRNNITTAQTTNGTNTTTTTPTKEQLETFWANIWEKEAHHNENAEWIEHEKHRHNTIDEMTFNDVSTDEIKFITSKLHNWKGPGIDHIHNYWYKMLTSLHKILAKNITDVITGKQRIPDFLATGITYMLPKNQHSDQPSQYRPITCLPTIYKIITSTITKRINKHIEENNIIAEEQKGCRRGHMGCKEQLIIDSCIHKHATTKNRNLHCSYIDYKKAFDSIPHSWLIQILQIYKINPIIIKFMQNVMQLWKTTLQINSNRKNITTRQIKIKKGIYQGDSLSPMWFCLALNPLSHQLRSCRAGYSFKPNTDDTLLSHLIYMDDIKLYARTEKQLKSLLDTTTKFSKDINMEFGLDKCKTLHIIRGQVQPGNYAVDDSATITALEPNDFYKYLGYNQLKGIEHTAVKQTLRSEYKNRINIICKTKLTSKSLIKAINTYAVPVLTYSFGIIKWSKTDTEQLERTTRTTLTKHKHLHPKSAIERLTLKRQAGGRGLIDIQNLWIKQIHKLKEFFYNKAQTSDIHKIITENDHNYTPLNLVLPPETQTNTDRDQHLQKIEYWKKKTLHGRHPHDLEQSHIDSIASNKWLKIGKLFPETEGFMIAIQDQVINTKNYRKHIIKDPTITTDKCRRCHAQSETIQHITGACTALTQTDYTHRHNQIANIIHQHLAIKHKLIQNNSNTPFYKYMPETILENDEYKLYYDRAILTDRTIHFNRPDITLQDKINKITYLIDIAVPNSHNLQKTITEKTTKYADLKEEITRIWKQKKVYVVPIVLSTTGIIPKHLHHSLKLLDIKNSTYITLQKAAILNTCRIVRKFMELDEQDHQ